MKQAEDISILITDKDFQRLLSEWSGYSEEKKAEIYRDYELSAKDVELLRQLWFGLDFRSVEHSPTEIEEALDETIWKLAERGNINAKNNSIRRLYEHFAQIAAILIIPIILYTTYVQFFKANQSLHETAPQLVTVSLSGGNNHKTDVT